MTCPTCRHARACAAGRCTHAQAAWYTYRGSFVPRTCPFWEPRRWWQRLTAWVGGAR